MQRIAIREASLLFWLSMGEAQWSDRFRMRQQGYLDLRPIIQRRQPPVDKSYICMYGPTGVAWAELFPGDGA